MTEFGQQFYEEDDAEQILRLAASLTSTGSTMSRDRLIATAAELGISPEAVEMAERQYAEQKAEALDRAEFDIAQRREFFGHLLAYAVFSAFLVTVNLMTSRAYFWAIWPVIVWGLLLAFSTAETFLRKSESYKEAFEKWRAKKRKRADRELKAIGNSDFLIEKYINRRLDRGKEVNKIEAIRYLRERSDLDLRDAKEAVEQYILRNPNVLE